MDLTPLTKEYFETHGWEREDLKIDGKKYWRVKLRKRYEENDHIYADAVITNLMYNERFAFAGDLGSDLKANVMLYTVEDYINLLKLAHVTEDFKNDGTRPYINKDIKV